MSPVLFAVVDAVLEAAANHEWRCGTRAKTLARDQVLGWWRSCWPAGGGA
jgi:hypothetical protein